MDNGESSYRRFLDGDTSGFDELIKMYREPLIWFINGFLHDISESEDIAEEVFVELIVHPKRYSFRSSLKTYLFTIARNKAVDTVRRQAKLSGLSPEETDCASDFDLGEHISRKENGELVRRCMEKINPEYAAALRLVYFENMTGDEAGAVLGKSKRQFANLIHRAKKSLRHAMEEEGFLYEE